MQGGVCSTTIGMEAEFPVLSLAITTTCNDGYVAPADALHCAEVSAGWGAGAV